MPRSTFRSLPHLFTALAIALTVVLPSAARAGDPPNPQSIHQEIVFKATPHQLYRILVDPSEFGKATGEPTTGSPTLGGTFSAFGGRIGARYLELDPDRLLVQVWRAEDWPKGYYSTVRFELRPEGASSTRLIFDHDGFPLGSRESLAGGWKAHYWERIEAYVASAAAPARR